MIDFNIQEFRIDSTLLIYACILDLLIGDPRWLPHPVVYMGRFIALLERKLNNEKFGRKMRIFWGYCTGILFPIFVFATSYLFFTNDFIKNSTVGFALQVYFASTVIAARSMSEAAKSIWIALRDKDIERARNALSTIVGRRTDSLQENEIARGAVESVSENTSDGIIAPLFYLLIGGIPLALAYKAVNTLDSMIGYKTPRYLDFGRASAKLDDALNFIPARITGLLIVMSSLLLRLNWKNAFLSMIKFAPNHPSPNAGYPEAAAAGSLGIELGGANEYHGKTEMRPVMGFKNRAIRFDDIRLTVNLMFVSYFIFFVNSLAFLSRNRITEWLDEIWKLNGNIF